MRRGFFLVVYPFVFQVWCECVVARSCSGPWTNAFLVCLASVVVDLRLSGPLLGHARRAWPASHSAPWGLGLFDPTLPCCSPTLGQCIGSRPFSPAYRPLLTQRLGQVRFCPASRPSLAGTVGKDPFSSAYRPSPWTEVLIACAWPAYAPQRPCPALHLGW